jgi:hypothetical protein
MNGNNWMHINIPISMSLGVALGGLKVSAVQPYKFCSSHVPTPDSCGRTVASDCKIPIFEAAIIVFACVAHENNVVLFDAY